ncbi:disease resistance protein RPS2-like [Cocos nucifera]|uniref:Disease resistance protein RPS2-like n=1 Tax=Cocos nucifera TaxID=13894 RepID=A0A8K0IPB2_COCNU|nr:disease resistance protein RPS2-like [Cocos nucifera]
MSCGIGDILRCVVYLFKDEVLPRIRDANAVGDKFDELREKLDNLNDKAKTMRRKVYPNEKKKGAAKWMFQVAQLQQQVVRRYPDILDRRPTGGNILSRYQAGREADKWLDKAKRQLNSVPDDVSSPEDRIVHCNMARNLVGIDSKVKKLKKFVKGPSMIMGICGMAGVGKATLVKKFNNDLYADFTSFVDQENRFPEQDFSECSNEEEKGRLLLFPEDHFDVVIFLDEEKTTSEDVIQQDIANRLGLALESKEVTSAAEAISKALESVKFLIIMVDLNYDDLDLKHLGIPHNGGSKVIFTTQKESVLNQICSTFSAQSDKMHLRCLEWPHAWRLFTEILQGTANERDASEIVKRCGGLPIALEAIANRMESKNHEQEWSRTLYFLEAKPKQIDELGRTVIKKLKQPYVRLKQDGSKTCFRYCALFPGKRGIKRDWLMQYWRGEGLTKDLDFGRITDLTEASLLERVCPKEEEDDDDDDDGNDFCRGRESHVDDDSSEEGYDKSDNDDGDEIYSIGGASGDDDEDNVKMHSMYRVFALFLTPNRNNHFVVQTHGDGAVPEDGDWKKVTRISLMMNDLKSMCEKITQCEKLQTLVLNGNNLHDIPPEIWYNMSYLKVLDLSSTAIEELPSEIERLKELVCLNLYKSKLKKLPEGLKHLKKLGFLNLGYTTRLEEIPHNVISSLEKLTVLIMYASYGAWDVDSSDGGVKLEELEKLRVLEELAITVEKEKVLKKLCETPQLAKITSQLLIRRCKGIHSFQLPQPIMSGLRLARVVDCYDLNLLEIGNPVRKGKTGGTQERKLELKGLPMANIKWWDNLSENMWLQSLTWLSITSCRGIKGQLIMGISTTKKRKVKIFGALRYFELHDLPELDRIYDHLLDFPSLRTFKVVQCPKLKALPFTEDGAKKLRRIYCEKCWWDELQGEGENLRNRLKHL